MEAGTVGAVVDRRMTPEQYAANPHARLVGVSVGLQAVHPACGGFGPLPLAPDVPARPADAGVRCVAAACGLPPGYPPGAPGPRGLL